MVFHWNLSDSKSPQIFKTLLSILADLNAEVWMVLIFPLISNYSSPFSKHTNYNLISASPSSSTDFLVRWQGLRICLFFAFFYFHFVVHCNGKIH